MNAFQMNANENFNETVEVKKSIHVRRIGLVLLL